MRGELQCSTVLGHRSDPLIRDAPFELGLYLDGYLYFGTDESHEMRHDFIRDASGVAADP